MTRNLVWLWLSLITLGSAYSQQSAQQILQRSLDLVNGNSNTATLKMSIIRPSWQRDIEIKTWSLGTEYSLILITSPARDRGTAFLKRDNELWNWQPRIERTIKLPPSMMLQSWMGSDFTNDDLVKQSSIVDDYEHRILGEESIDGRLCYKIELVPLPDAPVVWGKILTWIEKDAYLTLKNEFYDEDGYIVNTMYGKQVKEMDGRLIPTVLEVVPAGEDAQETVIEYLDIDFDVDIPESFFSVQNMKRVK
ncbi:MAG: outer membrane lipoprotein-sorting protein [Saprospiraceae bacterium]|nr:outer membrane lipoprotein-sorting protein [Saprospiraceae bacterium]